MDSHYFNNTLKKCKRFTKDHINNRIYLHSYMNLVIFQEFLFFNTPRERVINSINTIAKLHKGVVSF